MNAATLTVEVRLVRKDRLQAFADITICFDLGELTILGCRVLASPGEEPWVAFPAIPDERMEPGGKRKYWDVLEFSRGLRKQLVEAVLAEYARKSGSVSKEGSPSLSK